HGAYPKAKDHELIIAPCIAAKRGHTCPRRVISERSMRQRRLAPLRLAPKADTQTLSSGCAPWAISGRTHPPNIYEPLLACAGGTPPNPRLGPPRDTNDTNSMTGDISLIQRDRYRGCAFEGGQSWKRLMILAAFGRDREVALRHSIAAGATAPLRKP